ncbi:MAG: hypothetical protein V3R68_07585, partial [Gammaproteobacteria bacterium]
MTRTKNGVSLFFENARYGQVAMFAVLALGLALVMFVPDTRAQDGTDPSGIKIVVIGATARTADELIPQALRRGHEVVAFARRPQ